MLSPFYNDDAANVTTSLLNEGCLKVSHRSRFVRVDVGHEGRLRSMGAEGVCGGGVSSVTLVSRSLSGFTSRPRLGCERLPFWCFPLLVFCDDP